MIAIKTTFFSLVLAAALSGLSVETIGAGKDHVTEPDKIKDQPPPTDPKMILAKAIEAHGGRKNILKPHKGHLKGVEKVFKSSTFEEWIDLPKQWKLVQFKQLDGKKQTRFLLRIEGREWEWEEAGEVRQRKDVDSDAEPYFGLLITIVNLADGKYTLLPLESVAIAGKAAVGLRARWNKNEADFYFDKETGILVRWEMDWRPEPDLKYHQKSLFEEYKEIDGVKIPFRKRSFIKGGVYKDYFLVSDRVLEEIRILETLPHGTFTLPKKK